ncbi:small G protein signaling modulator 1 isoform X2 [Clupea harengus]|uniref:Small G protein signaling modulator 1 isoform X2 n=1 Tax=Clupea harengus TaxID=7950 RepID=A0A6P8EQ56_CLUHA|nr:small G protein signaling modulator 1 isoform X2 [Clupea harengus]
MGETETRQRLLRSVKKEVKQIMEEAVTRKFVHEDSSHIISFCAVVEACVLHGLRRRAAGFLRSNKLAALFVKVGKVFAPAEELSRKVQEVEQIIESKQHQARLNQDSNQKLSKLPNLSPQAIKYLWIRTALTEKVLDKIVLYLVENSSKFYEREALLRDPTEGPILASLLVGPCALEYTKAKTANHFWTDPSADELVQRHRIHSGHCRQDSPTKRPALITKRQSSGSIDDRPSFWARDYVESLHQNSRATLLFGKNNVLVQPTDDMESIPGYLSLHQTADLMTLKWTPNQLMNGTMGDPEYEKSVYWDFAMTIRLEEIVYLHCHQHVDSGGTVVLVSQDGIQRPPLRFPRGGHLLQFLTCLENGLLPHGQLDPPLWSQRGKGKVFPKLRRRSPHGSCESVSDKEEDEATDYVFRILLPSTQSDFVAPELIDPAMSLWQPSPRKSSCSSCSQNGSSDGGLPDGCNHDRAPLKLLCETMRYQIISRAFYGWLAYCRHLSTVRTHLSALVNPSIVEHDFPIDAKGGLTLEVWNAFLQDSSVYEEVELLRLVYYGGVDPSIRKEVWPFLLGHYTFTMTPEERKEVDEQVRASYEQTMSEWLGCEAIVKQREQEQHAAALARCSSVTGGERGPRHDSTVSSDSSQSSSTSERQTHASSHSDTNSSAQVFVSVDEEDQPELEAKPEEQKPLPKPLANGTSSPDSGHPSSRNFSTTSGVSDYSPSTDEASAHDSGARAGASQTPTKKPEQAAEGAPTSVADSQPKATPPQSDPPKPHPSEQDVKVLGEKVDSKKAEVVSEEASGSVSMKEETDVLESEPLAPRASEQDNTAPAMESDSGEALEINSLKSEVALSDRDPKCSETQQQYLKVPEEKVDSEKAKVVSEEALGRVSMKEETDVQESEPSAPEKVDSEERLVREPQKNEAEAEVAKGGSEAQEIQGSTTEEEKGSKTEEEKGLDRSGERTDNLQESIPTPEQNQETESSPVKTPETADEKSPEMDKKPDSTQCTEGAIQKFESLNKEHAEILSDKAPDVPKDRSGVSVTDHSPSVVANDPLKTEESEDPQKEEPKTVKPQIGESPILEEPAISESKEAEDSLPSKEISSSENAAQPVLESKQTESSPTKEISSSEAAENVAQPVLESKQPESSPTKEVNSSETDENTAQPVLESKQPELSPTKEVISSEIDENTAQPVLESKQPESSPTKEVISSEIDENTAQPVLESKQPESSPTKEVISSEIDENTAQPVLESKQPESSPTKEVNSSETDENTAQPVLESKQPELSPTKEVISSEIDENTAQPVLESKQPESSPTKEVISSEIDENTAQPVLESKQPESSPTKEVISSEIDENTAQPVLESKQPESSPTKEVISSEIDENTAHPVLESKQPESSPTKEVNLSETVQNAVQTESHSKEAEPLLTKETAESSVQLGSESKQELSPTKEIPSSEAGEKTAQQGSESEDITTPGMEGTCVSESEDIKAIRQGLGWALERRDSNPESEGCVSAPPLLTQQSSTLDLADSDDSPSALEMEEIPTSLICMASDDHWGKPLLTLDAPSAQRTPREPGMDMPILELRLEVGPNTSPEATESILSEEDADMDSLFPKADSLAVRGELKNELASPVSSIGTTYSQELLDMYMLNLHRIEKDVHRCDRNYWYFTTANLEKLRNIMCSYVWQHLEIGYVQGMCDLLAPLLVILDDEAMAFSCFTELMKRMNQNFPHGGAMDSHFANMRSLIQILDSELFELMQQNGDYTHFYFCYRWFLLDFKREMVYDDVFSAWETVWAARSVSSSHFVLFIALALVEHYRDIILENNMDFTEIIKFFNEMAERHDVPQVLVKARELVNKVQTLIENK